MTAFRPHFGTALVLRLHKLCPLRAACSHLVAKPSLIWERECLSNVAWQL